MYKQLSGIYAGKGLHNESNAAYAKMKKKECSYSWNFIWNSIKGSLAFICGLVTFILAYWHREFWVLFCYEAFVIPVLIWESCKFLKPYKEKKWQGFWNNIKNKIKVFVIDLFIILLGYGYKWIIVMFWYGLLISIGAYNFCNGEIPEKSLCKCACDCSKTAEIAYKGFTYSVYNSLGSYVEEYVCVVGSVWANFQTIFSFLLIGYLGFIFANKMRNNL